MGSYSKLIFKTMTLSKKIILTVVIIIAAISFIVVNVKTYTKIMQNEVSVVEKVSTSWVNRPLKDDKFEKFFPQKTKENFILVGTPGLQQIVNPTATQTIYISSADNFDDSFALKTGRQESFHFETARQAFYGKNINVANVPISAKTSDQPSISSKPIYIYSSFVGQLKPEVYSKYIKLITTPPPEESAYKGIAEVYNGHKYLIDIRRDLSKEALKGKESLGATVIAFPEYNSAVTLYFYETAQSFGDPDMITLDGMRSVARQTIDNVVTGKVEVVTDIK